MANRERSALNGDEVSLSLLSKKPKIVEGKRKAPKNDEIVVDSKVGISGLFRYATKGDLFLLGVGLLFAIIHGSSFPVLGIVFGQMTTTFMRQVAHGFRNDSFSTSSTNTSYEDEALSREEFSVFLSRFALYYLYIGLGVLTASFLQTLTWELAAERQVFRLRKIFFSQLLRQDSTWYNTSKHGDLTNKLSDDLDRVREGIGCKFSMVLQYLSTFISGILVGLYANWRLTCVILGAGPLVIAASGFMAKTTSTGAAREQLKYAIAGGVAEEVLSCIRTVCAFGGEKKELVRYADAIEEGRILGQRKYYAISIGLFLVSFFTYSSYGLAFWYGSELIIGGLATPGSVFVVFFSVLSGAFSIGHAIPHINSVFGAIGAASTIFHVIDRIPPIDPYSNEGEVPEKFEGRIEFQKVSFVYPSRPEVEVLRGLNLTISPSQTVAIVGASGAGKSTIVGLIMRFFDPSSGKITFDGRSARSLNLKWLRSNIGIVSQEPILFGTTIAENIRYGQEDVSSEEIVKAATLANAHSFIGKFPKGYDTLAGDRGAQMSGGQKQRIAIARALVRNPKILLLDEATSALDSHSEGIVQEALENAMTGRTTIIVAHRLSTIRNADKIYVMKDGCVVEVGRHYELMEKKGLYYSLVMIQAKEDTGEKKEEQNEDHVDLKMLSTSTHSINKTDFEEDQPEGQYEVSLWRLVKMNSPEWLWLLGGLLSCCVSGSIVPTFAFFYGQVFQTFTYEGEELRATALVWTVMFLVLAVVSGLAYWSQILCLTLAAEKLVARLRVIAFGNILKQPISLFDNEEYSTGKITTRLARDAPLVKAVTGLRIAQLTSSLVALSVSLVIAFVYGWKLALVLLIGVPLLIASAHHQTSLVRRNILRDLSLMDKAGNLASECVKNVTTVQALGRERLFQTLYESYLVEPYKEGKLQGTYFAIFYSLSQTIVYVMYAVAFKFGGYLIEQEEMVPSEVYKVFFALSFSATFIGTGSAYLQDFTRAKVSLNSLFRLIDNESSIDPSSGHGAKPIIRGNIEFKGIKFTYPSRKNLPILRGVNLTIHSGQTAALVGGSGCGKSTLISLLERFYTPSSGQILIDDMDIRTINLGHLRSQIGVVTQEPVLFNCSIKDNIAYGALALGQTVTDFEIIKAAKIANIHSFISSLPLGYETLCGERGTQLSGGQKQRIAIARALIRDPKILLLDEATSALDTESEKIVQEALDRAREGRTCIVVAHRLSTIYNADLIAVIHQGRVVEQGTHEGLRQNQNGIYYQLIKRQTL